MPLLFHAPNLNAPRFRVKRSGTRDVSMMSHINTALVNSGAAKMDSTAISAVLDSMMAIVCEAAVVKKEGVDLPEHLGRIQICACPPKNESGGIDYKRSREAGIPVRHRNWVTEGYIAKIAYRTSEKRYLFGDKRLWMFDAAKKFRSQVVESFPERWRHYELFNHKNPDAAGQLRKMAASEATPARLQNHDEFNL